MNSSRLFNAACIGLIVTAMTFAIRANLLAFLGHAVGIILTILAGGFWSLFFSTLLVGIANGFAESANYTMVSSLYRCTLCENQLVHAVPVGYDVAILKEAATGSNYAAVWSQVKFIVGSHTLRYVSVLPGLLVIAFSFLHLKYSKKKSTLVPSLSTEQSPK